MDPIFLQKQLRDNTNDLQDFCKELKDWSSEMKRKEETLKSDNADTATQPHSKVRKQKNISGSGDAPEVPRNAGKIKATDYAAWEKFDVEKECERIDKAKGSGSDSDLTDEFDESMKDEAMFEKEKGNKFVKNQRWDDAIECYTKAIACYGYDPIFYANRALCFLKKEKWKEAESDCTTALQLDQTYVKAYQRRAAAREKLNQMTEAKADLEKVLEYEPKNKESKAALEKLQGALSKKSVTNNEQKSVETHTRPVSKFTQMRQGKKATSGASVVTDAQKSGVGFDDRSATVIERKETTQENAKPLQATEVCEVNINKPQNISTKFEWPKDDTIQNIEPISKPPHMRSKVPLKRIPTKEIETLPVKCGKKLDVQVREREFDVLSSKKETRKKSVSFADVTTEVGEVSKKECASNAASLEMVKQEDKKQFEVSALELVEPTTSVQFFSTWKQCPDVDTKYKYLKVINPDNLKEIFKEALDSKTFSDVLGVLFKHSDDHSFVHAFLLGLIKVKRFSTLTFFLSSNEKEGVRVLLDALKSSGSYAEEDIQHLIKSFQL